MKIRRYIDEDYSTLSYWWMEHKDWKPISKELLSSCGFIIDDVCAGFLYFTNSKAAILEWVISNPESTKEDRAEGLDLLIDTVVETAKQEGYTTVFTWCEHPKLKSKLLKNMFVAGGDCTTLIRRV